MNAPARTPRGEATRQRLLAAAREVLLERNGGLELAEVAKRAGVSPGLPYRYFDSKSTLLVAVVDTFFDALDDRIYRPTFAEAGADWWTREQERIRQLVAFFYEEPLGALVVAQLAGDAAVVAAKQQRVTRQVRGATRNLALGHKLGRVHACVDVELAAAVLIGGVHQTLAQALNREPRMRRSRVAAGLTAFMRDVLRIEEAS